MNTDNRVIVSGCGPVGAVMTLALVKKGIPVTLIEQLPDAAEDQRAATIHTPTVEMLVELGLEAEMFSEAASGGMQAPLFHFRDRATGDLIAVFDISVLKGEVPYPYVVQWEQYKLVHAALPHIRASGLGEVRFSAKLVGLTQSADFVEATIQNAAGENETLRGKYLIGTDGGSSAVRKLAGIAFEGFTWPERFIKIGTSFDFGTIGKGFCTRNYFFDPEEWLNLFKVKGYGPPGIWRGVLPIPNSETDEQALSMDSIQRRLQRIHHKSGDYEIPYYALYAVHQRVAETFNKGRVLLAGDPRPCQQPDRRHGHERRHSRCGQSRRQARRVWFGRADGSLLDRYTRQRRKAQVDYVQAQTIENKRKLEEKDPAVRRKHLDDLRRTSEDVALHKKFLYRSSLIDSLTSANAVE